MMDMYASSSSVAAKKHQIEEESVLQGTIDESAVEKLLDQYQTYKTQFDEWTRQNRGKVSQAAYDKYVEDFRNWEKVVFDQIKVVTKNHMSKKKDKKVKKSKAEKKSTDQVEVLGSAVVQQQQQQGFSEGANMPAFDPMAMMMTMAMMMMQQQQTPQAPAPVALPPNMIPQSQAAPFPTFNGQSAPFNAATSTAFPTNSAEPPPFCGPPQQHWGQPRMVAPAQLPREPGPMPRLNVTFDEARNMTTIDYAHNAIIPRPSFPPVSSPVKFFPPQNPATNMNSSKMHPLNNSFGTKMVANGQKQESVVAMSYDQNRNMIKIDYGHKTAKEYLEVLYRNNREHLKIKQPNRPPTSAVPGPSAAPRPTAPVRPRISKPPFSQRSPNFPRPKLAPHKPPAVPPGIEIVEQDEEPSPEFCTIAEDDKNDEDDEDTISIPVPARNKKRRGAYTGNYKLINVNVAKYKKRNV